MRKVGAHYIYLPGFPLVKNGYAVLNGPVVTDVVETGGIVRELPALEFYGGMLVASELAGKEGSFAAGEPLLPRMDALYKALHATTNGLAILEGADLQTLTGRPGMKIRFL
ncbi:MAG: hypothetical protein LBR65_08350 [Culturomica sp.]|jgi:hypothetical protein|nr:hypothetical protein [Culturomica sp.]